MRQKILKKTPIVSIITVTKNLISGGRIDLFDATLKSISSQDYGRTNIEHIVIDGGSNDGTAEIIKNLSQQGKVDYWTSEEDNGIYNAMNKGVNRAEGEYFLILNSDDYLTTNSISLLVHHAIHNSAEYVFGNAFIVDRGGREVRRHNGDMRTVFFVTPYCHQALLCRTSCREKVSFDERYSLTMWPYAFDLYSQELKYSHLDCEVAYFRLGGLSTDTARKAIAIERARFRRDRILPLLGLSEDEYAYLSSMWRGQALPAHQIDVSLLVRRLLLSADHNRHDFARSFISLLENPSRNVDTSGNRGGLP